MKAKIFDSEVEVEPRYHVREGFTLTVHDPPFVLVSESVDAVEKNGGEVWVVSPLIVGVFYPRKTHIRELVFVFMRHFK